MALESTVEGDVLDGDYFVSADSQVEDLRKAIWSTIRQEKGELPWADVAFVLGIVQYELMHHSDEYE